MGALCRTAAFVRVFGCFPIGDGGVDIISGARHQDEGHAVGFQLQFLAWNLVHMPRDHMCHFMRNDERQMCIVRHRLHQSGGDENIFPVGVPVNFGRENNLRRNVARRIGPNSRDISLSLSAVRIFTLESTLSKPLRKTARLYVSINLSELIGFPFTAII